MTRSCEVLWRHPPVPRTRIQKHSYSPRRNFTFLSDPRAPCFYTTLDPEQYRTLLEWISSRKVPRYKLLQLWRTPYSLLQLQLKNLGWLSHTWQAQATNSILCINTRRAAHCFIRYKGKKNKLRHNLTMSLAIYWSPASNSKAEIIYGLIM